MYQLLVTVRKEDILFRGKDYEKLSTLKTDEKVI